MKRVFKFLSFILGCVTAALGFVLALTLYKARQFRKSMDINVDRLDEMAYFENKYVNYYTRKMRDFKVGAFFGTLTCEMGAMEFERREYDITVVAREGNVILVVPENVGVIVTTPDPYTNIADDRATLPREPISVIAVTAYLSMATLIIKNPDRRA